MSGVLLVLSTFLASALEMVEALTTVLAAGLGRGWRSSLSGVAAGIAVRTAVVAVVGPAIGVLAFVIV